ncbi:EndoU domain-containing protein [Pedobacter frigiditerrae]|uniref:EndoU domain-containing protein n=1 Tax=Pedobacter frigiditerrae TaxID=2530452 RepID=UPI00292D1462|nr:EndoU domain-containing protein [Pedobacter frigiditerrae]
MANAAVLIGGTLVRTTGFSNMTFNHKDGYLVRFTYDAKTYIHITKVNFRIEDNDTVATAGYFEEAPFLKYRVREIGPEKIAGYQLRIDLIEKGVVEDDIIVQKLKIVGPSYTDFCIVDCFSWRYTGGAVIDGQGIILIPPSTVPTSKTIAMHTIATQFYQRNITFVSSLPSDKRRDAAYLLALSAIQINNIQITVFPLFTGNATLESYIQTQNIEWTTRDSFINPSIDDFKQYFANVTAFYNITYANQIAIQKANAKTKLFWLVYVLSVEALAIMPVLSKIEILENLCYGTLLEGSAIIELIMLSPIGGFSVTPVVNQEEMALKVVKSVLSAPLQIDEFLARLISNYDGNDGSTLFEILYRKVDDFGGSENLKELMNTLYKLWLSSSYYPYDLDGNIKENIITPSNYINKAVSIGYEADTILWFFNNTNYDFSFNSQKIDVVEPTTVVMEHSYTYNVSIGTYGIYQTISIKNTKANIGGIDFISTNDGQNNVALPIFYLKYIDDKKDTENLTTSIQLTVDILLTVSAIGNLAKLKHIRSAFRLGLAALKGEIVPVGDILATYEFAQGVAGVVEITGSIGNIFILYSKKKVSYCDVNSSEYNEAKCHFYTKLDNIFIAMQLVGGVLDLATSKLISNSSKRLLEGPIPDDFNPDALAILRRFAGDIDQIKEIFRVKLIGDVGDNSTIWQRISRAGESGQFTIAQRDEFIINFSNADKNKLIVLNNDSLIDTWRDVEDLENFSVLRKDVEFLKDLRFIKNESDDLNLEVFSGVGDKKFKGGNLDPNLPINYTYPSKGVHHIDAINAGTSKIIGSKNYIGNTLYYNAKVEVYNTHLSQWKKKKTNKGYSTFFPDQWSKQKVQQEMALAFKNKKKYPKYFKGKMSDGVNCIIYIENGKVTTMHPSFN